MQKNSVYYGVFLVLCVVQDCQLNWSWKVIKLHARVVTHFMHFTIFAATFISAEFLFLHAEKHAFWNPRSQSSPSHVSDPVTVITAHKSHRTAVVLFKRMFVGVYCSTDALSSGLHHPVSLSPSALSKSGASHSLDSNSCTLPVISLAEGAVNQRLTRTLCS